MGKYPHIITRLKQNIKHMYSMIFFLEVKSINNTGGGRGKTRKLYTPMLRELPLSGRKIIVLIFFSMLCCVF